MSGKSGGSHIGIMAALASAIVVFTSGGAFLAVAQTAITTYHYDNNRTGGIRTRPC